MSTTTSGSFVGACIGLLFWLAVIIGIGFGWVSNIVKIVASIGDPLTAMFFLRCIGVIFGPLGVVLGYL
jgi:hypothetical protein